MVDKTKKTNKLAIVVVIVLVVLVTATASFCIYWFTGPHTTIEAVVQNPLYGPQANYEANGTLTLEFEAVGVGSLPATKVPFKLRTASDRCRLELFTLNATGGSSIFETFIVPNEKGGFEHYDRGNLADAMSILSSLGSITGTSEESDLLVMLGFPSLSSVELGTTDFVKLVDKAELTRTDQGYNVIISGSSIKAMLEKSGAYGTDKASALLGDAIDSATVTISYDSSRKPMSLMIKDANASKLIDMGFFGKWELKVNSDIEASFTRNGQVSAEETAVPEELRSQEAKNDQVGTTSSEGSKEADG